MKERFIYILVLVLSLSCISCERDDSMPALIEYPVVVEVGTSETKVGINGNSLFWQSGDQIQFRATGASGAAATAVLTLNDVDSGLGTAKFKGTVTMSEQPVKCEFAYNSSSYADGGKVIFDYSEQDGTHKPYLYGIADYSPGGMSCQLNHVGGLLRINVPSGVTNISLSSNSGTYYTDADGSAGYSGQPIAMVESGAGGRFKPVENSSHLISVAVPSGAETVYTFVPAVEYVDGVSIVCNHSDGSKMFKSFSEKGGTYSSYTMTEGSVLDLDLGDFVGFTADCTYSSSHIYEEGTLKGTKVLLTGYEFSGAPAKIIDQWGAAVYDSNNNFVRWVSWIPADGNITEENPKEMTDYAGDWPLLIPGEEYTVYTICSISGHTLLFPSQEKMMVGHPEIRVTPIAETSWSYRKDPAKANACGNNTIERLGLQVNVSNEILSSDNYGFTARIKNNTQGYDTGNIALSDDSAAGLKLVYSETSGEYELKNGDDYHKLNGLEWKTHQVTASVSFAGNTYSAAESVNAYVTGLPYERDFSDVEGLDGGSIVGSRTRYYPGNGYELNYYETFVGRKVNVYYSRKFPVPEAVDVNYSTTFCSLNTGQGISAFQSTIYTGLVSTNSPSKTVFKTIKSDTTENVDDAYGAIAPTKHVLSGIGSLSNSIYVSASAESSDKMFLVECVVFVSGFKVLYN